MANREKIFYAVRVGRKPGVYTSWKACRAMVSGYPGAIYTREASKEAAEAFLNSDFYASIERPVNNPDLPPVYAYVDGACNDKAGIYGFGGFIMVNGVKTPIMGTGAVPDMMRLRHVAGEVLGARVVVWEAIAMGLKEIVLFYNHEGVERWASGEWLCDNSILENYRDLMTEMKEKIKITFVNAKGHTDIEGNEEAAALARRAVDLPIAEKSEEQERWQLVSVCNLVSSESQHSSEEAAFRTMTEEYYRFAKEFDSGAIDRQSAYWNDEDGIQSTTWVIQKEC